MKTRICVTGYSRPSYFRAVLEGLSGNPGLDDYEVFAFIDNAQNPKVEAAHRAIMAQSPIAFSGQVEHRSPIGCTLNIRSALDFAFSDDRVGQVIMLEDDTVPGPDFLECMTTLLRDYRLDHEVGTVSGYARRHEDHSLKSAKYAIGDGDPNACVRTPDVFCCWGWGVWRETYETLISRNWTSIQQNQVHSWDVKMRHLMRANNLKQVRPDLSRIQNIGSKGGCYCPSPEYHSIHQRTYYWTGDGRSRKSRRTGFSFSEIEPTIFAGNRSPHG